MAMIEINEQVEMRKGVLNQDAERTLAHFGRAGRAADDHSKDHPMRCVKKDAPALASQPEPTIS